jgi:Tol biopolymer transport system component
MSLSSSRPTRLHLGMCSMLITLFSLLLNPTLISAQDSCLVDGTVVHDFQGLLAYKNRGSIEVLNLDTLEVARFSNVPTMGYPEFNPINSRFLAFGWADVYVLDTLTAEITLLASDARYPSWNPEGNKIVYRLRRQPLGLYVHDLETDERMWIPIELRRSLGDPYAPEWSPDGKTIAFSMNDTDGYSEIFSIGIDCLQAESCVPRRLTDAEGQSYTPSWSPDGSQIAFASSRRGSWGIYTMNADGTNIQQLTENEYDDFNPTYSPDGRYIAFDRSTEDSSVPGTNIHIMEVDGSNITCITRRGGTEPDWANETSTNVIFSTHAG